MSGVPRNGPAIASLLAGGLTVLALGLSGPSGCAHVAAPPGGPPDSIPPMLISILPENLSVMPGFEDEVRFEFDETISEQGIQQSVTVYPFELRPRVKKGKRELKVKPREGWVADRIYHIRVEPVVQDLFNNRIEEPIPYILSTGLPMPVNQMQGTVFDRITARPLTTGRIDFVLMPDTLRYGATVDSAGDFNFGILPTGDYLAIGYEDLNNNRRADDFDRSDTLRLSLGASDTLRLDFQVFRHDTVGPVLISAEAVDSQIVELGFDGYLDPDSVLDVRNAELLALPDSQPVALDTVLHAWAFTIWRDSVQAAALARADSLAAVADSLAAAAAADSLAALADSLEVAADTLAIEPDTLDIDTVGVALPDDTLEAGPPLEIRRVEPEDAVQPPAEPEAEEPAAEQQEAEEPAAEQQEEPEEPEEPVALPDRRLFLIAAQPIPAGSVLVRMRGVVNLTGLVGGGEFTYEQPAPPEPEPEEPAEEEGPPGEPPPAQRGARPSLESRREAR